MTSKSLVLFDAVGSKKYNTYHYQFIDADTVYYKSITPDTGCVPNATARQRRRAVKIRD